jgi:hypothetical protein
VPGLLLHQHPHTPADQILQPGCLEPHLLVEVHQNHPEQRQPAEDVERVEALAGVERRQRHGNRGCGGRRRHDGLAVRRCRSGRESLRGVEGGVDRLGYRGEFAAGERESPAWGIPAQQWRERRCTIGYTIEWSCRSVIC